LTRLQSPASPHAEQSEAAREATADGGQVRNLKLEIKN